MRSFVLILPSVALAFPINSDVASQTDRAVQADTWPSMGSLTKGINMPNANQIMKEWNKEMKNAQKGAQGVQKAGQGLQALQGGKSGQGVQGIQGLQGLMGLGGGDLSGLKGLGGAADFSGLLAGLKGKCLLLGACLPTLFSFPSS